jgi:hypothetical protein
MAEQAHWIEKYGTAPVVDKKMGAAREETKKVTAPSQLVIEMHMHTKASRSFSP